MACRTRPCGAGELARPRRRRRRSPPRRAATTRAPRAHPARRAATVPRWGAGRRLGRVRRPPRRRGTRAIRRAGPPARTPGPARPGRRPAPGPARRRRVAGLEDAEQPGQRPDVLVVVADDGRERLRGAAAQEPEVAARDLPAVDVAVPVQAQQARLGGSQPGVAQPVAEHPADDRQEVEVAGMDRRGPAVHPVPGDEQRPVEAAAVVGHEPALGMAGATRSGAPARRRGPAAGAGPAGTSRRPTSRARRGRPPSRRPWPARSSPCRGRPAARRVAAGRAASPAGRGRPDRPAGTSHRTTAPSRGRARPRRRPPRPAARPGRGAAGAARLARGPVACRGRAPGSGRAAGRAVVARRARSRGSRRGGPTGAPEVGEQPEREGAGIDARLEARTGAGGQPPRSRSRDQASGRSMSSSWRSHRRSDSPMPPGTASYR